MSASFCFLLDSQSYKCFHLDNKRISLNVLAPTGPIKFHHSQGQVSKMWAFPCGGQSTHFVQLCPSATNSDMPKTFQFSIRPTKMRSFSLINSLYKDSWSWMTQILQYLHVSSYLPHASLLSCFTRNMCLNILKDNAPAARHTHN